MTETAPEKEKDDKDNEEENQPKAAFSDNPAFGLPHETNNVTEERDTFRRGGEVTETKTTKKTTPAKKTSEKSK